MTGRLDAPVDQPGMVALLRQELAEVLEVDEDEIDPTQPLLELGADSIMLVEALARLQDRFGVHLRVRQIAEEFNTLELLGGYLFDLRQTAAPAAASPPPAATPPPPAPVVSAPTDGEREHQWFPTEPRPGLPVLADDSADFEHRYCDRTAGSKAQADAHRDVHADPRASAGFRRSVKEFVYPIIAGRSAGGRMWDIDGNEYVDLTMGFGTLLFGHAHPPIAEAVSRQLANGIGIGPAHFLAGPVADGVCELTGSDRAAFVATGTEAVMTAIRLARMVTGRQRIALFRGSYHGFWDSTLVLPGHEEGSAVAAVEGLAAGVGDGALLLPWGDQRALELVDRHGHELAAVLVEPIQSRRPEEQPRAQLAELRALTLRHGIALVFDEIITGFRLAPGGAAEWYGVQPDLATYGKVLGGGLPFGCVAGDRRFLDAVDGGTWRFGDGSAPTAETTFLAGTHAKHPLSLAAAWAVLRELRRPGLHARLDERSRDLQERINAELDRVGGIRLERCGSILRFQSRHNIDSFFLRLVHEGVYVWEGRTCFLSDAHTDDDLDHVVAAVGAAVRALRDGDLPVAAPPGSPPSSPLPAVPPLPARPPVVERVVPLTRNQQQVWLARTLGPELEASFHNLVVLRIEGRVHRDALAGAIGAVTRRHESMRATFAADGTQRIIQDLATPLEYVDLSDLDEPERSAAVVARITACLSAEYDFERGPLWRFVLVTEQPLRHRLIVSCSDLLADGMSIMVVLKELAALYEAALGGPPFDLPAPLQLHEYVERLGTPEVAALVQASHDYWAAVLTDPPPEAALPDVVGQERRTFRADRVTATLSAEVAEAVRDHARRRGVTSFSVLLSAFGVLVHRLTGDEDLVVGVPTLGRVGPGTESLVANCANPLPLRLRFVPDQTCLATVQAVQAAVFDAHDHAVCPLSEIVRLIPDRGNPIESPLFRLLFNLDPVTPLPRFGGDVRVRFDASPVGHSVVDLSAQLTPLDDGGISVSFDYSCDRFDGPAVASWLGYYLRLVELVASEDDERLGDLQIDGRSVPAGVVPR